MLARVTMPVATGFGAWSLALILLLPGHDSSQQSAVRRSMKSAIIVPRSAQQPSLCRTDGRYQARNQLLWHR
ncbi:hypothetical protein ACT16_18550 [Mycobacterium heckeshornense]|nr:hypothetical protein ACT16_18550 [Mycobacterium heckeshornense]